VCVCVCVCVYMNMCVYIQLYRFEAAHDYLDTQTSLQISHVAYINE